MVKEEALIGFASGAVYGITSLVVGHPLDTLKTKMQAQTAHMKGSAFAVFVNTVKTQGLIGLYRGCVPPLLGASVLRSVQFGVYALFFSLLQKHTGDTQLKILGIDYKIYIAGMVSGFGRALVECPLEVAKIRRQIGETWQFKGLFKGLGVNIARNVPLLATFFIFLDISKKFDIPQAYRPLITGSICSTLAWTLVWPFDVMKSQVQGSTGTEKLTEKVRRHYNTHGIKGFFRGYGPGATRSLIANGLSMAMYVWTEKKLKSFYSGKQT